MPNEVQSLADSANSDKYKIDERICFALKADSLSVVENDQQAHLRSLILAATLYLQNHNLELSRKYFEKAVKIAKTNNDYKGLAISLSNLGLIASENARYDSAIILFYEAQPLFQRLDSQKWTAQNLVNMGIAYEAQGNLQEAMDADIKAAKLLDSLKDTSSLASAFMNIADISKEMKQYNDAMLYNEKALQILKELGDSIGIAYVENNTGNIYRNKGNTTEALSQYYNALRRLAKDRDVRTSAIVTSNIGQTYFLLKDYSEAEKYFLTALDLHRKVGDMDNFLTTSNRLARLYFALNQLEKSQQIALNAFASTSNISPLKDRLENTTLMFEINRKLGNPTLSNYYAVRMLQLKDSLLDKETAKAIVQMSTKYKVDEKEKEIGFHRRLEYTQKAKIRTQYMFIFLLVVFLVSIGYVAFLFKRSNNRIKLANKQIESLMIEINHRVKNNLQLITNMLSLQLGIAKDDSEVALIQASINRVKSMNIIHTILYQKDFRGTIAMQTFINDLVSNLAFTYLEVSNKFTIQVNVQNVHLETNKAVPIGLILNEIITNVFKHSKPSGIYAKLEVMLAEEKEKLKLIISDDCEYWDLRTFKINKKGLGLFLVETFVKQLHGSLHLTSDETGTKYLIEFRKL